MIRTILFCVQCYLVCCILNSCDFGDLDENDFNHESKEIMLNTYLDELSFFKTKVKVTPEKNDSLLIEVVFLGDTLLDPIEDQSPYFLDDMTNDLVLYLLVFDNLELFEKQENILVTFNLEFYAQYVEYLVNRRQVEIIKDFFKNDLFYRNIKHSFSFIDYDEKILLNSTLKRINELYVNAEIENYTYWDYLCGFSEYLTSGNEELLEIAVAFSILCIELDNEVGSFFDQGFKESFKELMYYNRVDYDSIKALRDIEDIEDVLIQASAMF